MSTETVDYYQLSEIELTQLLKQKTKEISKLQVEQKDLQLNTPVSFIRSTEIDAAIDEIQAQRTAAGKCLLQLDLQRKGKERQNAKRAQKELDSLVDSHLDKLTKWARRAQQLKAIAAEYDQLVIEAKRIESLNNYAARGGYGRKVGALVPRSYRDRMRKLLISTFGFESISNINPVRHSADRSYDITIEVERLIKNITSAG